tara:strand:- start:29 stop:388 length:360 start_codon:yes stop_codon:yes gene_type:complete
MPTWNELLLDLEEHMNVYVKALKEIAEGNSQSNPAHLVRIAETALDSSTSIDDVKDAFTEHKPMKVKWVSPHDPGDEDKMALESRITHVDFCSKERKELDMVASRVTLADFVDRAQEEE